MPILYAIAQRIGTFAGRLGCGILVAIAGESGFNSLLFMGQKTEKSSPTLEAAMQRIGEVVAEMEEGNLPLETLITRYEEGVSLVKMCQEKLDAAEKRIQIITRNARGAVELKDFEPADEGERA